MNVETYSSGRVLFGGQDDDRLGSVVQNGAGSEERYRSEDVTIRPGVKDGATNETDEKRQLEDIERMIETMIEKDGVKMCKRCSQPVVDEDDEDDDDDDENDEDVTDEETEEQQADQEDLEGEDCPDGQGVVHQIERKCSCRLRSVLRRRVGDKVLCPTLIIKKYHKCLAGRYTPERVEPVPKTSLKSLPKFFRGCLSPQKSVEDVLDFSQITTMLNISDPSNAESGKGTVELGAVIVTLADELGKQRHFVEKIIPGSAAEEMGLRFEDELLLLNDSLLVNVSADKLREIFAGVNIYEEFIMFTRRALNTGDEDIASTQVEYEYWSVRVTIGIDVEEGIVVPQEVCVTKASPGDIRIIGSVSIRQVYIEAHRGYFYNVDGVLKIRPQLVTSDQNFRFDRLTYNACVMVQNNWESIKIKLLRATSGEKTYFLRANKKGIVKLKEYPRSMKTTPGQKEFSARPSDDDSFFIKSGIFLEHKVSKSKKRVFLESHIQRGKYVCLNTDEYTLYLVNGEFLNRRDDVKFNYHYA